MESTLFLGVDHPAVAADNVTLLADWYCDVLGYSRFFETPRPIYLLKAPDNTFLEVMPKDEHIRIERTVCTPGWSHLAFRVSNLDEAVSQLEAKGVTWASEIINAVGGGRLRSFFDPEGNMLQLVERNK